MKYTLSLHSRSSPFRIVLEINGDPDSDSFHWTEIETDHEKPFFMAASRSLGYFDNSAKHGEIKRAIFKGSGVATDKRPPVLELQICRLPEFKIRDFEHCWQGNILRWADSPNYQKQSLQRFTWRAEAV